MGGGRGPAPTGATGQGEPFGSQCTGDSQGLTAWAPRLEALEDGSREQKPSRGSRGKVRQPSSQLSSEAWSEVAGSFPLGQARPSTPALLEGTLWECGPSVSLKSAVAEVSRASECASMVRL